MLFGFNCVARWDIALNAPALAVNLDVVQSNNEVAHA